MIDGECEEVEENVYLNGIESPVLQIVDSQIILERPVSRLFDGKWTAEYTLKSKEDGQVFYSQRFQVQITSLINAMPRFKDHSDQ